MRWGIRYTPAVLLLILTGVVTHAAASVESVDSLYKTARQYSDTDNCIQPSPETIHTYTLLFKRFIDIHERREFHLFKDLNEENAAMGMMISRAVTPDGTGVSVLHETGPGRWGRGFYVLVDNSAGVRPVIIQTPHARSDALTGQLGLQISFEMGAAAFFSSTMRRDVAVKLERSEEGSTPKPDSADLCHNPHHYFQSATRAYAMKHPDLMAIQLHGFTENPKDHSRNFDTVLSFGLLPENENLAHRKIKAAAVKALKNKRMGLFGIQTQELGALTNVQGKFINGAGAGMFVHVELSRSYRESLLDEATIMKQFIHMMKKVKRCYEKL